MKTKFAITLIVVVFQILFAGCKKKEDMREEAQLSKLPQETQIGADTFGCLINGKAFKPKVGFLSGADKQHAVYGNLGDGFNFNLSAVNSSDRPLIGIVIRTTNLELEESKTYKIRNDASGNAWGALQVGENIHYTVDRGELHITKFDPSKKIISGTFWYDVTDNSDKIYEIRNGRFDMPFND